MTQNTWTDERIKELRWRWEAGESATIIGASMHLTRGSIMGKITRLGLIRAPKQPAALKQLCVPADRPLPSMPKIKWLERNYSIDNVHNLMNF